MLCCVVWIGLLVVDVVINLCVIVLIVSMIDMIGCVVHTSSVVVMNVVNYVCVMVVVVDIIVDELCCL